MTHCDDSAFADLLTEEVSEARHRLIHDLATAYRASTPAPTLHAAVLAALHERESIRPSRSRWPGGRILRPWTAGLTAALTLVLAGTLVVIRGQTAAPVSAQTILNRAAGAGLTPNQATHFTYHLTASNGFTGTSDLWIQADANGAAGRLVLSNTVLDGRSPASKLDVRLVESGDAVQVYDPASNTVTTGPGDQLDQPWESIVVGTRLAQKLSGSAQSAPSSRLLQKAGPSQQTLDGTHVYVIHLSATDDRTLYVDVQSYIPRGADWSQNGVSWQARLVGYENMAPAAVPAGTWSLNAPASATTTEAVPDKSDYPVDLGSAFAQACDTTQEAYKAALGGTPGQSMLAACQQTNPAITADQLSAALLASAKSQLDAAVAAGQITSAQEKDQLDRMQAKLADMITSSNGPAPPK